MITRRLLLGSGMSLAALPAAAQLGAGSFRIGVLGSPSVVNPDNKNPWMQAFVDRLAELGYTRGRNLTFEMRLSEGDEKRLPEMAGDLLAARPDVIFVTTTPALMALFKLRSSVPVVFLIGFDPIKLGVTSNLARPDGNFTGVFNAATDLISKNFQIIRDLLPNARRVAHLVSSSLAAPSASYQQAVDVAAQRLGFEVKGFEISDGEQLPASFARMAEFKADALTQGGGPFWAAYRKTILDLILAYKLPSLHIFRMDVVDGALMSYGSDMEALFRTAASQVDRILQGAKPSDLPIEQATKLIFVINMKTAKAFGLDIPPLLLAQAAELIE